jgi:hypothetical protein
VGLNEKELNAPALGTGTSLDQFRACLSSSYARTKLDIHLTDDEAGQIAADDTLSARWYEWWMRRPEGAQMGTASQMARASSRKSVSWSWIGILAGPVALVLAGMVVYAAQLWGSTVGWWIAAGLLAIVIAIAGILASTAALRDSAGDYRAITAGYIGLVLSVLTVVAATAATALLALIVWR